MGILIPLLMIVLCCLFIWRACDGFELASEYIGRNLSEGVRGGTINAISSSVPELLTTLIALFALHDRDGFAMGIGTTAGSALFNGMIIPAVCILAVVGFVVMGVRVTSVNISTKVLLRDGLSLIFCELILIVILNGTELLWWQGAILMGLYITYFLYMVLSMKDRANVETTDGSQEEEKSKDGSKSAFHQLVYWVSGGPLLDLEKLLVREPHRHQMREEKWNGWPLLFISTAVMALVCWMLVIACEWLGSGPDSGYTLLGYELSGLDMPVMFVAVIFASMATSVPDTVISIRDAKDGDYDDAVANALGSNIFDICFALGFPLFLYTLIYGSITMSDTVAQQSAELRLMLLALTIAGFFVYFLGKRGVADNGMKYVEMKRGKAVVLLTLYIAFAIYIIARGQDAQWAEEVSGILQFVLDKLPSLT